MVLEAPLPSIAARMLLVQGRPSSLDTIDVHRTRLPYWCYPGKRHEPGCMCGDRLAKRGCNVNVCFTMTGQTSPH